MSQTVRAVLVDPSAPGNIRVGEAPAPTPLPGEALVRVAATSINRGEIRRAAAGPVGRRIGWDFAGTIEKAAADGTGPREGTRVVGMLTTGAWAELVASPTEALGVLPEKVSFQDAAALPVAGLTALLGLEKGGSLLGQRVLVTGGTGGVGHLAIQIGRAAGAHVTAVVRAEAKAAIVRDAGADDVIVGDDPASLAKHAPFDVVLDGVGGPTLGVALTRLAKHGTCVVYGATAGAEITFNAAAFYPIGGATLYGFILFHELVRSPAGVGLTRLAGLVAEGKLRPRIDVVAPLDRMPEVAQSLVDRAFHGKAVVTF
jgi:NADPH:quinone reductase-like Zn-dependent oxidoreductase